MSKAKFIKNTTSVVKPTDVIPVTSPTTKESANVVKIPRNIFQGFSDILREQQLVLAKTVANEFNLQLQDVISKCLPDVPLASIDNQVSKSLKPPKSVKPKITDYKEATSQDDLKCFKIPELKDICSENKLPVSGSKSKLMARVWGIVCPSEAPVEPKKKRGRKPKKQDSIPKTVSSSPIPSTDEEICELDSDKMDTIYFKNQAKSSEEVKGSYPLKLFKNRWLFKEEGDNLEYTGEITGNNVSWSDEPPSELLKLLGME